MSKYSSNDRYEAIQEIEDIRDEMIELLDRFVAVTKTYKDVGYSVDVVRTNILSMLGARGYNNRMGDMENIMDYLEGDENFDDDGDDDGNCTLEFPLPSEPEPTTETIAIQTETISIEVPRENIEIMRDHDTYSTAWEDGKHSYELSFLKDLMFDGEDDKYCLTVREPVTDENADPLDGKFIVDYQISVETMERVFDSLDKPDPEPPAPLTERIMNLLSEHERSQERIVQLLDDSYSDIISAIAKLQSDGKVAWYLHSAHSGIRMFYIVEDNPEPPAPHNSRKANEGYEPIATCDSSPSLPLDIQLFEILTIEYANRNSHFYSVMMPLKNIADTVTYYKPLRRLAGSLFDYLAQSGYRSKAQTDFAAMIAEMRGYEIANRMVFHKANAVLEAPDTDVTVLPKPEKEAAA